MNWLITHPPARPQWRSPRRAPISGVVVVHNSGGRRIPAVDLAKFIRSRPDPGSYHTIIGADGEPLDLLPDDVEAHGVTTGDNAHAWHICLVGVDGDFRPADPVTGRQITAAAAAIAAFWLRHGIDPLAHGRWLTRDQAQARRPGLVHHGDLQPADRSDAWARSPHRKTLDRMLIDAITAARGDDDSMRIDTVTARAGADIWIIERVDGRPSRLICRIPGPAQLEAFKSIFRTGGELKGDQALLISAMLDAQGGRR